VAEQMTDSGLGRLAIGAATGGSVIQEQEGDAFEFGHMILRIE